MDPTGSLAATASGDFSVQVWDAITGQSLWQAFPHKHIVKTCDFSPDSRRLATGGHEGVLRVFDLTVAAFCHMIAIFSLLSLMHSKGRMVRRCGALYLPRMGRGKEINNNILVLDSFSIF